MKDGRRPPFRSLSATYAQHAGLWLDKGITGYQERGDSGQQLAKGEQTPPQHLVDAVAAIHVPDAYRWFYSRWYTTLKDTPRVELREAEALGRMAVGLGAEGVLETSITLHRTYGVPVIPGSGLKGLAASFARKHLGPQWEQGSAAYTTLFGSTDVAGYVTFFDALYKPPTRQGSERPLYADIITVHHPDYYGGKDLPPADWDSPTPVPFLSATGRYLVALQGPPAWVTAALDILTHALRELGVGAKTSSGYGRMQMRPASAPPDPPPLTHQQRAIPLPTVTARPAAVPQTPQAPAGAVSTITGRIIAVAADGTAASVQFDRGGIKRLPVDPSFPGSPHNNDRVRVQLDANGNPQTIIELLQR